jgi:hypothetical protein
MSTLRTTTMSLATLTAVLVSSSPAFAASGSGTWSSAYPLPVQPGRVLSQTSSTAVVRSTDTVLTVKSKLDATYVNRLGCTRKVAVNKPRDYLCRNAATGKTDEVYFTFAALDPKPSDASRSQTNAYLVKG